LSFCRLEKISDQKLQKLHFDNISRMKGRDFVILHQSVN